MNDDNIKVKILNDILEKKKGLLNIILTISENQEVLLNQPQSSERVSMFREMSVEKQKNIDEVLVCDNAFQSIFDEVKDCIERDNTPFRDQLVLMQTAIDEVLTLDVSIRAQETKNREMLQAQMPVRNEQIAVSNASKQRLLSQYKQFNKKQF